MAAPPAHVLVSGDEGSGSGEATEGACHAIASENQAHDERHLQRGKHDIEERLNGEGTEPIKHTDKRRIEGVEERDERGDAQIGREAGVFQHIGTDEVGEEHEYAEDQTTDEGLEADRSVAHEPCPLWALTDSFRDSLHRACHQHHVEDRDQRVDGAKISEERCIPEKSWQP